MPDGAGLGNLINLLGGAGAGVAQPATEGQPDQGLNYNALASLLGQLAGAVAPGTTGARLGQVGAETGQANILAGEREAQLKQLQQFLGGLTGPGFTTTGLNLNPKTGALDVAGSLEVPQAEGTQPTTAQTSQTPTTAQTQVPAPVRDVSLEGGGTVTTDPFLDRVRGL